MSGKLEQSGNIYLDQYDLLSQRPALLQVMQALLIYKNNESYILLNVYP
jgi:hypothetical protein